MSASVCLKRVFDAPPDTYSQKAAMSCEHCPTATRGSPDNYLRK